MAENYLITDDEPKLSVSSSKHTKVISYEIMHKDNVVAVISSTGYAKDLDEEFMPYDLYLDSEEDIDTLLNNLNVFYHWCASRVLTLDRKFAKEILNCIGVIQAVTDRDRANISLSYHCVSLTDVYWVREKGENVSFSNINLYDNTLNEAVVELSLKGRQMTVTNEELAQDLSTKGCFPKAWIRQEDGFKLLKDGGENSVIRELLASKICQCFDIPQVKYNERYYEQQLVSESRIITSKDYSIVNRLAFGVYALNHNLDVLEECEKLDPVTFYGMNILDYLIGNNDRHQENWGVLVDNSTNKYISLYPLMDFNQSFMDYDIIEGGVCQTLFPRKISQREAAIEAVKKIGLPIIKDIDMGIFGEMKKEADMFERRLSELKNIAI